MKDKNTIRKELTKNFKGFISGKETSKLFVVAGHSSDENRYHIARMLSAIENEEFDGSFDVVVQNDTPNSVFLTIFIEEMGAFYDDITLILCGESCAISMPQVNNCLSSLVFHAPVIDSYYGIYDVMLPKIDTPCLVIPGVEAIPNEWEGYVYVKGSPVTEDKLANIEWNKLAALEIIQFSEN